MRTREQREPLPSGGFIVLLLGLAAVGGFFSLVALVVRGGEWMP
jgi:hypothetical protein